MKEVDEVKFNPVNMNVILLNRAQMLSSGCNDERELNIDVRNYITVNNSIYHHYILEVIEKFDYMLRQHIIKFVINRFSTDEARKPTSINNYIDSLEEMKFIKKMKLNNNNYYMLTQKGYIYLTNKNNVQAKRKPSDNALREKVFLAQYYIENSKEIDFDFLGLEMYLKAYEPIFNYLKQDPHFAEHSFSQYISDYIFIVNILRKYRGTTPVTLNGDVIKNHSLTVGPERKYQYKDLEVSKFSFFSFIKYLEHIIEELRKISIDRLFKEIESGNLTTPILVNAKNSESSGLIYGDSIESILRRTVDNLSDNLNMAFKFYETYVKFYYKKFYLSSDQYINYQRQLLKHYLNQLDADRRNIKRDDLATLQYSKIYLSGFREGEIEVTILDMDRNSAWYRDKLLEIDMILRRMNLKCQKHITARIIVYVDDSLRKEYVDVSLIRLLRKNKRGKPSQIISDQAMLSYLNADSSIHFIRDDFEIRINSASKYLEKGTKDVEGIIIPNEIVLENLK